MAQRTWRLPLLLTGALLAAALGACGDPDPVNPIAGPSGSTASTGADGSPAPGASGQPAASTSPEVMPTKPGAPAVCNELRASKLADTISTAVRELSDPATAAAGKTRALGSVTSLTTLAGKAEDPLKSALTKLGTELTKLAQNGMSDITALESAGNAALELDDQTLATCGFPLSEG